MPFYIFVPNSPHVPWPPTKHPVKTKNESYLSFVKVSVLRQRKCSYQHVLASIWSPAMQTDTYLRGSSCKTEIEKKKTQNIGMFPKVVLLFGSAMACADFSHHIFEYFSGPRIRVLFNCLGHAFCFYHSTENMYKMHRIFRV